MLQLWVFLSLCLCLGLWFPLFLAWPRRKRHDGTLRLVVEVPPCADVGQLAHSLDFASYGATGGGTHLDALWIPGLRPAFLPNLPVHSPDELRLALQLLLRGIANENGTVVSRGCGVLENEEPSTSDPRGKIHATRTLVFCWNRLAAAPRHSAGHDCFRIRWSEFPTVLSVGSISFSLLRCSVGVRIARFMTILVRLAARDARAAEASASSGCIGDHGVACAAAAPEPCATCPGTGRLDISCYPISPLASSGEKPRAPLTPLK